MTRFKSLHIVLFGLLGLTTFAEPTKPTEKDSADVLSERLTVTEKDFSTMTLATQDWAKFSDDPKDSSNVLSERMTVLDKDFSETALASQDWTKG